MSLKVYVVLTREGGDWFAYSFKTSFQEASVVQQKLIEDGYPSMIEIEEIIQ